MKIKIPDFLKNLFKKPKEVKTYIPKKEPCSPRKQIPCDDCICGREQK